MLLGVDRLPPLGPTNPGTVPSSETADGLDPHPGPHGAVGVLEPAADQPELPPPLKGPTRDAQPPRRLLPVQMPFGIEGSCSVTSARKARQCLVASVLPAPDSPEMRMAWSAPWRVSAVCAAEASSKTCGGSFWLPGWRYRSMCAGEYTGCSANGLIATRMVPIDV